MARDPLVPADPGSTQDSSVDPSQTIPNRGQPQGSDDSVYDGGEYEYWLRDGVTPYRTLGPAEADVFSRDANGWMMQHTVARDSLWPSGPGEVAGMIGGRHRLTEPTKGAAPLDPGPGEDFAPVESPDYMAEADSGGDLPQPDGDATNVPQAPPSAQADGQDLPSGGMTEEQIRDAGLRIDVPFESPLPADLKYKDTGQQVWTPPPGFRQGLPPIDDWLAERLGVPRDLGTEGAEGGSGSGELEGPGA
jgi:hypothetical protein